MIYSLTAIALLLVGFVIAMALTRRGRHFLGDVWREVIVPLWKPSLKTVFACTVIVGLYLAPFLIVGTQHGKTVDAYDDIFLTSILAGLVVAVLMLFVMQNPSWKELLPGGLVASLCVEWVATFLFAVFG